jgi:hypothetical protein
METVCRYLQDNYNYKSMEIVFKLIEKDIYEIIEKKDHGYILNQVLKHICPFNLKRDKIMGKYYISFIYRGRKCDIIESTNNWIVTMYPFI